VIAGMEMLVDRTVVEEGTSEMRCAKPSFGKFYVRMFPREGIKGTNQLLLQNK